MKFQTLDLHGLSIEEAVQKTKVNIEWSLKNGVDVLDINHGKGHHSSRSFSVIKQEIRKMLKQMAVLKDYNYKVVYGESNLPIALTFDEGHTLIVYSGLEKEYLGGAKQQEKNQLLFSREGRMQRKAQKAIKAQKRKR
ncbi:MAG: hypothetical protein GX550_03360 [Syntrophomonadaceae bacterium]|nr:hypothetical protein [Syntrophomonadaceae bacterium]